jgi:hypothetical protein
MHLLPQEWRDNALQALGCPNRIFVVPPVVRQETRSSNREAHWNAPHAPIIACPGAAQQAHWKAQARCNLANRRQVVDSIQTEPEHLQTPGCVARSVGGQKRQLVTTRLAPGGPERQNNHLAEQISAVYAPAIQRMKD